MRVELQRRIVLWKLIVSDIVGLIGFDAEDPGASDRWGFANANEHTKIHGAIQAAGKGNLVVTEIYPIRWENPGQFLLKHQSMHNEVNQTLGVAGTDLTGIDFKNKAQLDQWNQAHFDEHKTWATLLGI